MVTELFKVIHDICPQYIQDLWNEKKVSPWFEGCISFQDARYIYMPYDSPSMVMVGTLLDVSIRLIIVSMRLQWEATHKPSSHSYTLIGVPSENASK